MINSKNTNNKKKKTDILEFRASNTNMGVRELADYKFSVIKTQTADIIANNDALFFFLQNLGWE